MPFLLQPLPSEIANDDAVGALVGDFFAGSSYSDPSIDDLHTIDGNEVLALARQLGTLLGPAYSAPDGSPNAADLVTFAVVLGLSLGVNRLNLGEAFPNSAFALLPDWERMLGLATGNALTVAQRQLQVLAKYRARGDGSLPALARTVHTLAPEAVLLTLASADVLHADPAYVFKLVVLLSDRDFDDDALRARLDPLLGQQVTGHANWTVGVGAGPDIDAFRCDDIDSECDRDLLNL